MSPSGSTYLVWLAYTLFFDAPQSVASLWTCGQSVAENSTWQHITLLTDKHPSPGGIRTNNLSRRAAEDLRLRPRGHWDRHLETWRAERCLCSWCLCTATHEKLKYHIIYIGLCWFRKLKLTTIILLSRGTVFRGFIKSLAQCLPSIDFC